MITAFVIFCLIRGTNTNGWLVLFNKYLYYTIKVKSKSFSSLLPAFLAIGKDNPVPFICCGKHHNNGLLPSTDLKFLYTPIS